MANRLFPIIAARCLFSVTQLAAGALSVASNYAQDKKTKAVLNAAIPVATLFGYVGGNAVIDLLDDVARERRHDLEGQLRAKQTPRGLKPVDAAKIPVLAKTQVALWHDMPWSTMNAAGAIACSFWGKQSGAVVGAAVGGAFLVGMVAHAALPIAKKINYEGYLSTRLDRTMQCAAAVGSVMGLAAGLALTHNSNWIDALNASAVFLAAAVPPIAALCENLGPALNYLLTEKIAVRRLTQCDLMELGEAPGSHLLSQPS